MHNGNHSQNSTPKRSKKSPKNGKKTPNNMFINGENYGLFEALLDDPVRKKMVVDLINANKRLIDEYEAKNGSPLQKLKQIKPPVAYESPTAVSRRKAMENKLQSANEESDGPVIPSSQPLEQVLKNVRAFVEVNDKSKDCSDTFKKVLVKMGARVSDSLDKYVTHVIYKGGSYNTFNRANLLHKHLVSVLWVDSAYKYRMKMPEKNYSVLSKQATILASDICDKFEKLVANDFKGIEASSSSGTIETISQGSSTSINKDDSNSSKNKSFESSQLLDDPSIAAILAKYKKTQDDKNEFQNKIKSELVKSKPQTQPKQESIENSKNCCDSTPKIHSKRRTLLEENTIFEMETPPKRRKTVAKRITKSAPKVRRPSQSVKERIDKLNASFTALSKTDNSAPPVHDLAQKRRLFNPDSCLDVHSSGDEETTKKKEETKTEPSIIKSSDKINLALIPSPLNEANSSKEVGIIDSPRKYISCTRFSKKQIEEIDELLKSLGNCKMQRALDDKTTHLVAFDSSRTVNVLNALVSGIWVLKSDWLYESQKAGEWLPEDDFEMHDMIPVIKENRIKRQTLGDLFTINIFNDCGPFFIADKTNPSPDKLKFLISKCNGKVVENMDDAKVVIGTYKDSDKYKCVKESWILDCITYNRCISGIRYLIKS